MRVTEMICCAVPTLTGRMKHIVYIDCLGPVSEKALADLVNWLDDFYPGISAQDIYYRAIAANHLRISISVYERW